MDVNVLFIDNIIQLCVHGFQALADANLRPNRVYFMDIPDDCVVERLSFRLTDPITGERLVKCVSCGK